MKWLAGVALLVLLLPSPSLGGIIIYTDPTAFQSAIAGGLVLDFDSVDTSGGRVPIGGSEFPPFSFSSPLAGDPGKLWNEPLGFFYSSNFLSTGERPFDCCDANQDDLAVTITGNWRAFGMETVDNGGGSPESITFIGDLGVLHVHSEIPSFIGIVTDSDFIRQVVIDELADDSDDVGYDNFTVGNPVPVPEPASLLLFSTGLVGLNALRKRRG